MLPRPFVRRSVSGAAISLATPLPSATGVHPITNRCADTRPAHTVAVTAIQWSSCKQIYCSCYSHSVLVMQTNLHVLSSATRVWEGLMKGYCTCTCPWQRQRATLRRGPALFSKLGPGAKRGLIWVSISAEFHTDFEECIGSTWRERSLPAASTDAPKTNSYFRFTTPKLRCLGQMVTF